MAAKNLAKQINAMTATHTKRVLQDQSKSASPGVVDWYGLTTKIRRPTGITINKTAGTIVVALEGSSETETISFVENSTSITYTRSDGLVTTVEIS